MYICYLTRGSADKNELVKKITVATGTYNANHTRNRMSDINTSMDMIILKKYVQYPPRTHQWFHICVCW